MTRSRQRRDVPRRRVVFVGVEGKSDRAFVRFLGLLCDRAGLHVHLDVRPSNGGDSLEVVRETARRLRRHPYRREIATRLVLLDSDRMRADRTAGRDALAEAEKRGLKAMLFNPNLEGLLVRLHKGYEARRVPARGAENQLRKLWSPYSKSSLTADQLRQRFSLGDLKRTARHDEELRKLLAVLGLIRQA